MIDYHIIQTMNSNFICDWSIVSCYRSDNIIDYLNMTCALIEQIKWYELVKKS